MRISPTLVAAVGMTLAAAWVAGCSSGAKSSSAKPSTASSVAASSVSTSAAAQQPDYTGLLIQASDINAPETFTATAPMNNPNGQPGVTPRSVTKTAPT